MSVMAIVLITAQQARAQGAGASTAGESYANGIGDIISATGQFAVSASQANVNNQTAVSMGIDNRLKWTNTYFEMRRINGDSRQAEHGTKYTTEDWIRLSKLAAPKRLSSVALDPISGRISWPPALSLPEFGIYRAPIEQFYAQRAEFGVAPAYQEFLKFQNTNDSLLDELKKRIATIPSKDYLMARNFIESLGYEARFASN
jgi:hypothetical protein